MRRFSGNKEISDFTNRNQVHIGNSSEAAAICSNESGFSLIETTIALVIILVALLGVFFTITFAITYNMGNNSRAQTVAVLQQEVERLRSAKFTPGFTDPALYGTAAAGTAYTTTMNGQTFSVTTVIDNDPSTTAIDDETTVPSSGTSFKEITVTTVLANPSPGWQTAVPAKVVMRRVKSN